MTTNPYVNPAMKVSTSLVGTAAAVFVVAFAVNA